MDRNNAESVIKETIEYANNEIKKNRKKSRRIVIAILAFATLITAFFGSCLISYVTFDTANPFSAISGYCQIIVLDKEYVEIQKSPKIVVAQPNDDVFLNYMDSRGFTEIEDERMGAMRVFTNGEEKEFVLYSINAHCSKWCWQ